MSEGLRGSYYGSLPPELRLVLLGNIGCGKTSCADTILGQLAPISPSASRSCQLRQGVCDDRNVTVVEAPRWYWSGGTMEESVRKETARAMTLVAPGPHAILLLVPVSQFTEMECQVPTALREVFGEDALDHTLVLLTCGDYLMGRKVEEYLQKEHPGLRQIIEQCGGRYHVINNRQRQNREQVRELLEKVDDMVKIRGSYHIKTAQERELERRVQDRKRELLENFRVQKEERRETHVQTRETQRSYVRGEDGSSSGSSSSSAVERDVSQASNGLHSTPAPELHSYSELHNEGQQKRTLSFRLSPDGAMLSKMSEKSPKVVTTLYHRINSLEEKSPAASPTATSPSPFFSSPSSPNFASSPSPTFSASFPTQSSSSSSPELRLVLLGRCGAGKSAAGNAILGREEFESRPDTLTAITLHCEKKKALVNGRRVAVIDTPDWFTSERTPDEVRAQISSCVTLSSPGPHAFLMCVPLDQPAKTELQALWALESVFGPEAVQRHTVVLFTYADKLRESGKAGDNDVEEYIAAQRGDLLKLVEECMDRFHVLESGRSNVEELLEKVEQTVKEAGGQCYTCPAFQEAEGRVKQRQVELAREKKGRKLEEERQRYERQVTYPYMEPVAEEVREDEIEKTRDEAEMSIRGMNIESLPPISLSHMSPSLLSSIMERMESYAKNVPKLLADGSVWVGEGAKKVKSSPVWGSVSSGAQNVQKMVAESSAWGKVGAGAGHVSKLVGDRVPKVVVDGSTWVGSGAKAAAASPVWGKVGSGAKLMADRSMRVGTGIGTGAKSLAQSPMWGKVGSGAKSGAKLMAENSARVGAGIGASAKRMAQSPVWGQMGSGAKAGAKMVAESSVWEKIGTTAKQVPKVVIAGALLGLVLGVFLGGAIGGAIGAAAGSAVSEVGRRKLSDKNTLEKTDEAVRRVENNANDSMESLVKQGHKLLKTE